MLTTSHLNRFLVTSLMSLPLIVGFPAGTSAAENLDNGGTNQTLVNAGIDEAKEKIRGPAIKGFFTATLTNGSGHDAGSANRITISFVGKCQDSSLPSKEKREAKNLLPVSFTQSGHTSASDSSALTEAGLMHLRFAQASPPGCYSANGGDADLIVTKIKDLIVPGHQDNGSKVFGGKMHLKRVVAKRR